MDPSYLQGLREAKSLLDEGVFSKEVQRSLHLARARHARVRRSMRSRNSILSRLQYSSVHLPASEYIRMLDVFMVYYTAR